MEGLNGKNKKNHLNRFERFKRNLERYFIGNAAIAINSSCPEGKIELNVSIECNHKISEGLYFLCQESSNYDSASLSNKSILERSLDYLGHNKSLVDISELELIFCDCSIIISKLFPSSILIFFDSIIESIQNNYLFVTKGNNKTPFEIHLPVLPLDDFAINSYSSTSHGEHFDHNNYFEHWCLYYDYKDFEQTIIYDVKQKANLRGNLTLGFENNDFSSFLYRN